MIGSRQVLPKTALVASGGAPVPFAVSQQLGRPVFVDSWLPPFVVFQSGALTKCYGYASVGTFTAQVFIDDVLCFTVTDAANETPVDLAVGQTGTLAGPSIVTFKVTAASSNVSDIFIEAVAG